MDKTNGQIEIEVNGVKTTDQLFTYDEGEKQQHEVNRSNAFLILNPEFIPFNIAIFKKLKDEKATLVYGFIKFFLSNNEKFYCTNEHLAELLDASEWTISMVMKKLQEHKLIKCTYRIKSGGGKLRIIKLLDGTNPGPDIRPAQVQRLGQPNDIYNKIIENNKLTTLISVPNKNTKLEYGNKEINNMLLALKTKIGISAFTDSSRERMFGFHCVRLIGKMGKVEFVRRLDTILKDGFKRKNCNSIRYVYNQIKGFIEPNNIPSF